MKRVFRVGGCVRDKLLGLTPKDIDFVVVGATPEEMIADGFVQVGADFPVFLKDGFEYALARKERKVAAGYHGFETEFDISVTLEEDLIRRDLTINSMAQDLETGEIIDPFGGREDLKNKVLRHTSEAFAEDPLRVLRVARFAARYQDFKVADETLELMKRIVRSGELQHLSQERIVLEFEKAFSEPDPMRFIACLFHTGALHVIFPELAEVVAARRPADFITWIIVLRDLKDVRERLAFLLIHFAIDNIAKISDRMKFPSEVKELALDYLSFKSKYNWDATNTVNLFDQFKVAHDPQHFWRVFHMFNVINEDHQKDPSRALRLIFDYNSVNAGSLAEDIVHLKGKAIGEFIRKKRIVKIENWF